MRYRRMSFCFASIAFSITALGQATVDFDHVTGGHVSRSVQVEDLRVLTINVTNTCPAAFTYEYVAFEKPSADEVTTGSNMVPVVNEKCAKVPSDDELKKFFETNALGYGICAAEVNAINISHQAKYGAYLLDVKRKTGPSAPFEGVARVFDPKSKVNLVDEFVAKAKTDVAAAIAANSDSPCASLFGKSLETIASNSKHLKKVDNASLIVSVDDRGWTFGIAGAFTGSTVVNPQFALVDDPDSETEGDQIILRDRGAEDDVGLGVAAMIHLYNPDLKGVLSKIALTFGLGVREGNSVSYFVGPSWRFGKQGFATIGVNFASVDRLPAGQRSGSAPQSENVLNNLGSRTETGAFLSLSYSFLSPGEAGFRGALATKNSE